MKLPILSAAQFMWQAFACSGRFSRASQFQVCNAIEAYEMETGRKCPAMRKALDRFCKKLDKMDGKEGVLTFGKKVKPEYQALVAAITKGK